MFFFRGKDVAKILGYKNTDDAIKRHVSENHKKTFLLSCPRESRGQVIKNYPVKTTGQVIKSCPPGTGGQVQGRCYHFLFNLKWKMFPRLKDGSTK